MENCARTEGNGWGDSVSSYPLPRLLHPSVSSPEAQEGRLYNEGLTISSGKGGFQGTLPAISVSFSLNIQYIYMHILGQCILKALSTGVNQS